MDENGDCKRGTPRNGSVRHYAQDLLLNEFGGQARHPESRMHHGYADGLLAQP